MQSKFSTREYNEIVGHRIKFFRRLVGMSQTELADKLGYTSSGTISLIERGKIGMNKAKVAMAAKIVGVHPLVLTTEEKLNDEQLVYLNKFIKVIKQPQSAALNSLKNILNKAIKE